MWRDLKRRKYTTSYTLYQSWNSSCPIPGEEGFYLFREREEIERRGERVRRKETRDRWREWQLIITTNMIFRVSQKELVLQ